MNRYDPGIRLLTRDALLPEADALLKKIKTIMPCQRRIEWAGSSGEVPRLFVLGGPAPVRPWSSHTIDFHMPSAMPLQPDHGRSITIPAITSTISTARIAATGSNFQAERIGKISKSTCNWQTHVFQKHHLPIVMKRTC